MKEEEDAYVEERAPVTLDAGFCGSRTSDLRIRARLSSVASAKQSLTGEESIPVLDHPIQIACDDFAALSRMPGDSSDLRGEDDVSLCLKVR